MERVNCGWKEYKKGENKKKIFKRKRIRKRIRESMYKCWKWKKEEGK